MQREPSEKKANRRHPPRIRGGTDGATLSHKGLPCPNLGTGGYAYHGPMEHVTTVEGMETVVRIIKKISEKSNCIVIIPYFCATR